MTPTTWQGRYTLPAAPVTFALRSWAAFAAHEPSRLGLRVPGSVPARAASTETTSTRSVRTALSGDGRRAVWDWFVKVGMDLFCPTPPLRPASQATSPACGGRRSHAGVTFSSPIHGGGARQGGGGGACNPASRSTARCTLRHSVPVEGHARIESQV